MNNYTILLHSHCAAWMVDQHSIRSPLTISSTGRQLMPITQRACNNSTWGSFRQQRRLGRPWIEMMMKKFIYSPFQAENFAHCEAHLIYATTRRLFGRRWRNRNGLMEMIVMLRWHELRILFVGPFFGFARRTISSFISFRVLPIGWMAKE